jgi:hypothetical protein
MPLLPEQFSNLEPFAAEWCFATEPERQEKRLATSIQDITAFYDATTPRLEEAMSWLDQYALNALPPEALNLMYLVFSLCTVSFAVECWHQPRIPDIGSVRLDLVSGPTP